MPKKLTKEQIAEIKETPRVLGAMTELANRFGVRPNTIGYHWGRMHRPEKRKVAAGRILEKGEVGSVVAEVAPLSTVPKESLPVIEDPKNSLAVLQTIRDDQTLPADVRTRASVALLVHGKEKEAAVWAPPTDEAGWISVLVDLILDQPDAVRAGVIAGLSS